jgi:hypothetical protein
MDHRCEIIDLSDDDNQHAELPTTSGLSTSRYILEENSLSSLDCELTKVNIPIKNVR